MSDWEAFVARQMGRTIDYHVGGVAHHDVRIVGVRRSFSVITFDDDNVGRHGVVYDLRLPTGGGLTTKEFPSPFPADKPIPGWSADE